MARNTASTQTVLYCAVSFDLGRSDWPGSTISSKIFRFIEIERRHWPQYHLESYLTGGPSSELLHGSSRNEHFSELLKTISIEELYANNPPQIQRFTTQINPDVHINAQIALIDETNKSQEIEIGISKMPCSPCSYYINRLNNKYNRRFCSANSTHGRIYSTWDYRHGEGPAVLDAVNQKLIERIKKAIITTCMDK